MKDIKLYPHNQEAYNKIKEMWKTTNRVADIQATGTGKSYIILKCLYDIPEQSKIVLAPSNYILEQLTGFAGEEIPNTILMTYSDLSFDTENKIKDLNPSLIVLDEFHRGGAEQWGSGLEKLLVAYPNAKILGTSATAIRFLDNERDMADELFDGNIAVNLSLADAIVKKILPMPKYVSALYTFEDEANNLKAKVESSSNDEDSKKELLKEIDLMKNKLDKSKGIPEILKKYLQSNNGKYIIFCKNKTHLDEMKWTVRDWFRKSGITKKIETYSIYTGYENSEKEFELFKKSKTEDSVKLLFSIDMFNEGIHIEGITGAILLRPTVSPIIYYQQIGRAISVGSGEPIILDFVNNFDNIGSQNFIVDLKESKEKRDKEKHTIDNIGKDEIWEFKIFDEMLEVRKLFNDIESRLVDNWVFLYEKLVEWKKEYGNCNVPYKENILGRWVVNQRSLYKKNKLTKYRIKKLEEIGFIWKINNTWTDNCKLLQQYKEENGHTNIPQRENAIGMWLSHQRDLYNKGKLDKRKIREMENVGVVWDVVDMKFELMFNLYIEWINKNNKYPSCKSLAKEEKNMRNWITGLRRCFKLGKISEYKKNKMESINFIWNEVENKWEIMFNALKEFKKINGNFNIPIDYKVQNTNLHSWIVHQRGNFNKGKLNNKQIALLNSINFDWSKIREYTSSGCRGVYYNENGYSVYISVNTERVYVGYFKIKLAAIKARRDAELKYWGKTDINLDDYKELIAI